MGLFDDHFDLSGWTVKTSREASAEGWGVLPQASSAAADHVWLEAWYKKGNVTAKTTLRNDLDQSKQEIEVGTACWPATAAAEPGKPGVCQVTDRLWARLGFDQRSITRSNVAVGYSAHDRRSKTDSSVTASSTVGTKSVLLSGATLLYMDTGCTKPSANPHVSFSAETSLPSLAPFSFTSGTEFKLEHALSFVPELHQPAIPPLPPALSALTFGFRYSHDQALGTLATTIQSPTTIADCPGSWGIQHTAKSSSGGTAVGLALAGSVDASENLTLKAKWDVLGPLYLAAVLRQLPGNWQFVTSLTYSRDSKVPSVGIALSQSF
ncbi:hypothetical protein DIPPA_08240 [Diplonema papillatum]|nr:hypothetical protein DIPPA_08240 [Diplonema papillatum]